MHVYCTGDLKSLLLNIIINFLFRRSNLKINIFGIVYQEKSFQRN